MEGQVINEGEVPQEEVLSVEKMKCPNWGSNLHSNHSNCDFCNGNYFVNYVFGEEGKKAVREAFNQFKRQEEQIRRRQWFEEYYRQKYSLYGYY